MERIAINTRNVLLTLILFLLTVPFIQHAYKFFEPEPLKGALTLPEEKQVTLQGWFSGEYQLREEKYLNETFGFRSFFVRLNNQLAFELFRKAKAKGVIIGKDNYLYEDNYIKAYYGTDFIGVDSITHRMQRLKFIQDTLLALNKTMILVFAPGKGSFYPEYFPENSLGKKGITNYEHHIKLAKKLGLSHIDFNRYFRENKYKSPYPLYPKYGIHWSYYAMCVAADSMIHYIEQARSIDMPDISWQKIDMEDAKERDNDIGEGMNLLFKLKSNKMAYPHIRFEQDFCKTKPSALVVADSYYWGMFNFGISKVFSHDHFWFYNKQIYPDSYRTPLETNQVNLKDQIAKHDVIIIMATDITLPALGWGFIEDVYQVFHKSEIQK